MPNRKSGSAIAFASASAHGVQLIAVADLAGGGVSIASSGADGAAANGDRRFAAISADGRYVSFGYDAGDLVGGVAQ